MTILNHLIHRAEKNKNNTALQFKDNDKWVGYRWHEYFSLIETVAAALSHCGLLRGDRVAIISETRPEWIISDLAIMAMGGVTVPVYPNNLSSDVEFILNDSKATAIFLENYAQYEKWLSIRSNCPSVKHVIVFKSGHEKTKEYISWIELLNMGREHLRASPKQVVDEMKKSQLSDVATILYTSGTTGRPKGVVLSHEQIMSELEDAFTLISVNENDKSLTFLPYSHVFGRVEAWGNVYAGYTLAFAESIDRIKANLSEIKPTFLVAVPRIFEKIYAGILTQLENNKTKQKIFLKAQEIGLQVSERLQAKKNLGPVLMLEYEAAKLLVFNKILKAMGGRLRFAISGGAPLSAEISRFFHGIGLLICEGYGLTETTAGITFNSPLDYKFGSVGKALKDVTITIAEDGEILVKSKKVMLEYYNNPKATSEVFFEGKFRTGDIGHIDEDGFLFITDRKKDLIKTAGGKYVAPQKLENILKLSPYISNVLIHGDQKKYIIALVTLNAKYAELHNDQEMYKTIKDFIAEANTQLASYESIKKFSILPQDFTVETGELTPSLKVKRRFCDQKFKKEIDDLY